LEKSGYLSRMAELFRAEPLGSATHWAIVRNWASDAFFLCQAYQWCNDKIAPVQPKGFESTITYRHRPSMEGVFGRSSAAMTLNPHLRGERSEDKLVLRSGYDAQANHLVASLDRPAGHDHQDTGAIITWTHQGRVYLHGPFYYQREAVAHNLVYCGPMDKSPEEEIGTTYFTRARTDLTKTNRCVTNFIEDFSELTMTGYSSLSYHNRLATWNRTIIYPRDGAFLLVVDELDNRGEDFWAAPLWHFEKFHGSSDWWADCEHGDIPANDYTLNRWPVEPGRVLVAFPLRENAMSHLRQRNADFDEPRPHINLEIVERHWSQQEMVYQAGKIAAGQKARFITLLLPHDVAEAAESAADRIKVVAQDKDAWCLEVSGKDGTSWTIGMVPPRMPAFYALPKKDHHGFMPAWLREKKMDVSDPHGDRSQWFTAGPITTDAEIFCVRKSPGRTYMAMRRMRAFEMGNLFHHAEQSPHWSPTRFQVNAEFDLANKRSSVQYSCRNFCPIELSLGIKPGKLRVQGGVNGVATTAEAKNGVVHVALNGLGKIIVEK